MSERPVSRPWTRALIVVGVLGVVSLVACGLSVSATGGADTDGADALAGPPAVTGTAPPDAGDVDGGPHQQDDCDGGTTCDGGCTDLASDPLNCNRCGNACPSGDTCDNRTCAQLCINDTQRCGGACVDLETDPMHCGACTTPCTGTDVCSLGKCVPNCPLGLTACPTINPKYCADILDDHDNCGGCGIPCTNTEVCTNMTCTSLCAAKVLVGDIYGTPPKMVGCVGNVLWKDRATLCAGDMTPCTPEQWVARYGGVAPKYNYWTDTNMGYSGSQNGSCSANETGQDNCASYSGGSWWSPPVKQENPMRVCTSNKDGVGNHCYWDQCGLNGSKTNQYFGGCVGDSTASTLCCSP